MSQLKYITQSLVHVIENHLKPFDKALLLVPDDKLHFKPAENTMTISELGIHVYQCILVNAGAIKQGDFTKDDYDIIPFDTENIISATEIVEYGKKVKEHFLNVIDELTEEDLDKEITYSCWGGFKAKGNIALNIVSQEVCHHRGQLCVYLRILRIQPPHIYDYS
ncbi:MAG: DinB family protein [Promethearchaeota archaeon]